MKANALAIFFLATCWMPEKITAQFSSLLIKNNDPNYMYQCIRVQGDTTANNANLYMSRCDTTTPKMILNLYFPAAENPPGYYVYLPNWKCMTIYGGYTSTPGTIVNQYDCVGSANQKWWFKIDPARTGYQIINPAGGLCLTLNSGTLTIQNCATDFSQKNQVWDFMIIQQAAGNLQNLGLPGKCLRSTATETTVYGAELNYATCNSGDFTQAVILPTGNTYGGAVVSFMILYDTCPKVNSGNPISGTHVVTGNCSVPGSPAALLNWQLLQGLPGPFQLYNSLSSKCLTASADGTYTYITTCAANSGSNPYQFWTMTILPEVYNHQAQNLGTLKCLHIVGDSSAYNAYVEIATCSSGGVGLSRIINFPKNMVYNIGTGSGTITFQNGMCLTVYAGSDSDGNFVNSYTCVPGSQNQQWKFVCGNIYGYIQIKTAMASGNCLTVEGTQLIQRPCVANVNDNKNQFWTMGVFP